MPFIVVNKRYNYCMLLLYGNAMLNQITLSKFCWTVKTYIVHVALLTKLILFDL